MIATTAEMFRDFAKRYGDKLPTVKGDFTPYWEDGAGSSARETALNRGSAERLVQAETLFALLQPSAYPAARFQQAWRNVILYDEHTWGAYNSISQPDAPFAQSAVGHQAEVCPRWRPPVPRADRRRQSKPRRTRSP